MNYFSLYHKFFFSVISLFLILISAHAQDLQRTIQWNDPIVIHPYFEIEEKEEISKTFWLNFENATYPKDNGIPFYYELLSNRIAQNFKVQNIESAPLSAYEKSLLPNNFKAPNSIVPEVKIVKSSGKTYSALSFAPFINNKRNGQIEKVTSFTIYPAEKRTSPKTRLVPDVIDNSVLSSGNWFKIRINSNGIYKITYEQLTSQGVGNPVAVKIYGNSGENLDVGNMDIPDFDLRPVSISYNKGTDGIFNEGDYIYFYAEGPGTWKYDEEEDFVYFQAHPYSNYNYYFLQISDKEGPLVSDYTEGAPSSGETINTFRHYQHYEIQKNNLLKSGKKWFGEEFYVTTSREFGFEMPHPVLTAPLKIKSRVIARSAIESGFTLLQDGTPVASVSIPAVNMSSYTTQYAEEGMLNSVSTPPASDNISIGLEYNKPSGSSVGYLDYITINAECQLVYNDKLFPFALNGQEGTTESSTVQITTTENKLEVWDISRPSQPVQYLTNDGANQLSFNLLNDTSISYFIAFNPDEIESAEIVSSVENQNLHALSDVDMLIVSHEAFLSQAEQIKELHENEDNLNVELVTAQQIYNEFSSGKTDPAAIRNFLSMLYHRNDGIPDLKYLLLFGDGSYNNLSESSENTNYLPTYQSNNSLHPTRSFVSDDFFGLLDPGESIEVEGSGLMDIGIGRFPVQTAEEAQNVVNKVIRYTNKSNYGDWLNKICFVGDDEDNNIHMRDANFLAEFVDTTYKWFFINKLYLDAFKQESSVNNESYPEVNRLINDQINNGVLIFNYTGHGGEKGLAHERILALDDINSWSNTNKLAIFMTATCEFSRFDDYQLTSAGERVLLNPRGGGIALYSTTRLVYSSPNYTLNRKFYDHVFDRDSNGEPLTLGEIMKRTKINSGTGNNKRNFTLLGDPALKMPVPHYTIVTDSINGNPVESITDTLRALSKVTIAGHIEDNSGNPATTYTGTLFPLILDKEKEITTLSNDGGNPFVFNAQTNAIYKGKVSIKEGRFNFSFVVPKDISYNFGNGKISYYSTGLNKEGKGAFNNFIIGGSASDIASDEKGPEINLYMNNEDFISGGVTNENPVLYAVLYDSSGINTVGSGIGHDITAIVDDNTRDILVLNDYYKAEIDSYQEGRIEYLFSELEEGNHNIRLKVWDVYNNSNEEYLEFVVASSAKLAIKNVMNYPNPFTDNTSFFFDHNRPNENLEVLIQIFTVSGKLIKTIDTIINADSFRSEAIPWNGLDDFGDKIGRGVYIYRILVKAEDRQKAEKIEKLVILK